MEPRFHGEIMTIIQVTTKWQQCVLPVNIPKKTHIPINRYRNFKEI